METKKNGGKRLSDKSTESSSETKRQKTDGKSLSRILLFILIVNCSRLHFVFWYLELFWIEDFIPKFF